MEEEQDFSDNYQNEEDEENFNKLDVITEENNYNSENNNYSTNKKGEKDKIKSSSSSKYSNEIQTFKQQNEIIGTENIKRNFQKEEYFNREELADKENNLYNKFSEQNKLHENIVINSDANNEYIYKEGINENTLIKPDFNNNYSEKEEINEDNISNSEFKNRKGSYNMNDINEDNYQLNYNNKIENKENQFDNDSIKGNQNLEKYDDDKKANKIINNYVENPTTNLNKENNKSLDDKEIDAAKNEGEYLRDEKDGLNISFKNNLNIDSSNDKHLKNTDINSKSKEKSELMELYSYEGNEKNTNFNDNMNEEYFINQNLINFQNKNIVKSQDIKSQNIPNKSENIIEDKLEKKLNNNNSNLSNIKENEKFYTEIPYKKEGDDKIVNDKKRSGVIQLNNFKLNNSCNNISLNISKEDEVSFEHKNKLTISLGNKDIIKDNNETTNDEEKEKENNRLISSQKGAMKILQLLISKKQEKEELEKKKEEIYIETFKRARSTQIKEEKFSEKDKDIKDKIEKEKDEENDKNSIINDNENVKKEENKNEDKCFESKDKKKIEKSIDIKENKNEINININKKNIDNIKNKIIEKDENNKEEIKEKSQDIIEKISVKEEVETKNKNEIIKNENNEIEKKDNEKEKIINSQRSNAYKGLVYIKNKKIPYKKFKTSTNVNIINNNEDNFDNKSDQKKVITMKQKIPKISEINKLINIVNKEKEKFYNYNLNINDISSDDEKKERIKLTKSKIVNQNKKKSLSPFNNYKEFEQQTNLRNKRKKRKLNGNDKDHSMLLHTKPLNSLDYSFDTATTYKKRNPKDRDLSQSPTERVYTYKRPINKRKYNEKYDSNQINDFDINKVIKNRIRTKINKSISPINHAKKLPISNENGFNTNYNIINNNEEYNNNYNINLNRYNLNNKQQNKKKYLINSKTSDNFKKDKMNIGNYKDFEILSDNNYDQYNSKRENNNFNINNTKSTYNVNTFYKRSNNYDTNSNYQFLQRTARYNQSLPYIQPAKLNVYNNDAFFNENNYGDNNYDNKIISNYNKNAINKVYNDVNIKNKNNYYNINSFNQNKRNNSITINIEDIMILEEKLNEVILFLKKRKEVKNQCFDFWNYFYNSSIHQKIEKTFKNKNDIEIIKISINYQLISIMLCYEFSCDKNVLFKAYILLLEILELNHRNLMIICENILNKIDLENQTNICILKLYEKVENSKSGEEKYYQENTTCSEKINYNTDKLSKKLKSILLNYKTEFSPLINSLLKKISQKNYEEINDFFREYIFRIEKIPQNELSDSNSLDFTPVRPPYILEERTKSCTLVLGLDETLVNFQQINYSQGVLKLRPFLLEFLEAMSQYYELILFTTETEYYAEPIIKAIEQKRHYFDYVFYREHCIMIGNDYIKDLTRIGRPLDSTIIVDNMPQYFRFQKENGIIIKSFWAQDPEDKALYNLIPILMNIVEDESDVRDGIAKYRNEIVNKISSNIYKNYN